MVLRCARASRESSANILTFLENKRLFARTTYIRLLIYLKAIYGQKMKEIDFSTLATRWSIFPDRRESFTSEREVNQQQLDRALH